MKVFALSNKELFEAKDFEVITSGSGPNQVRVVLLEHLGSNADLSIILNRPSGYFLSRVNISTINFAGLGYEIRGILTSEVLIKDKKLIAQIVCLEL